jgi:DnaJ-class molecular chaperone
MCNRKGTIRCSKCNSKGEKEMICPECKGVGEKILHDKCAECNGKGRWHKTPDFHKASAK